MKPRRIFKVTHNSKSDYKPFKKKHVHSISKIKEMYSSKDEQLDEDDAQQIREAFDFIHEIIYQSWVNKKLIDSTKKDSKQNEESHFIYPSEYRRAS